MLISCGGRNANERIARARAPGFAIWSPLALPEQTLTKYPVPRYAGSAEHPLPPGTNQTLLPLHSHTIIGQDRNLCDFFTRAPSQALSGVKVERGMLRRVAVAIEETELDPSSNKSRSFASATGRRTHALYVGQEARRPQSPSMGRSQRILCYNYTEVKNKGPAVSQCQAGLGWAGQRWAEGNGLPLRTQRAPRPALILTLFSHRK
ncbi:hypothetical protein AAFF_G00162530 [Aldrovandia affinis]|uniref:Uncharacterized protein n=1 Tax=Aldrovandia affinis TaxID=143900 RepID=A0AAD7SZC5_9TELE|nr:hypothetical protein AAFF_G00162530 [Aldrovandia affinis]